MLAEWHLTDRAAGSLLFSSFAGSTFGAMLVPGSYRRVAGVGLGVTALASGCLSQATHGPFGALFLLYGLGMGVTMTAISLLRSREVSPNSIHLEMNRLNLLWAMGACLAPALALRSLRLISVHLLFQGAAILFGVAAVSVFLTGHAASYRQETVATSQPSRLPRAPAPLWMFAAAAVALESAIGSWLTTYTERVAHHAGIAVWSNSAFWMGLLLSRAAHSSRRGAWLQTGRGMVLHLAAVVAALLFLVGSPLAAVLPVAAFLAGAGLGPLYPSALAVALPRYRSLMMFIATGVGAAVLPWVTGALSTAAHSLRAGLLAPCATVVILLVAARSMRHQIPEHNLVPAPISTTDWE